MRYLLTYARTVILQREIEASDKDKADDLAFNLERAGELNIQVEPTAPSEVILIQDEENIWEIKEREGEEDY